MPGVVEHDQSLLLAMIPVVLDLLPIASNDFFEAVKVDVFLDDYVQFISSKLFVTSLDILCILGHEFDVLEALEARPLSESIVLSVLYYAPVVSIWHKHYFLLSFDHESESLCFVII